jgi:hypothetical protein
LVGLIELEIASSQLERKKEARVLIEERLPSNGTGKISAKDLRETLIGIFELA